MDPALDRLLITDSVPPFRLTAGEARKKIDILPVVSCWSKAVRRLHAGGRLSDLFVF